MKKFLLTTTAASILAAGSALADGPTVTIGGYTDFQVGSASAESVNETGNFSRTTHSQIESQINISVDGQADNGLGYGARIELNADIGDDDSTDTDDNAERAFIYVESGFGRVELGANDSATDALKVDASSIARATGGIDGDTHEYVALGNGSAGGANDEFLITPDLPTAGFIGLVDDREEDILATANKITYYSPRISGVQAGISYTPDLNERGTAAGFSGDTGTGQTDLEDIWNIGLNYQGEVSGVAVEASLTGEFGDIESGTTRDDLEAYAFGLSASKNNITVAGSIGQIDEFGQLTAQNVEASFWTLGAAYEQGPFAVSISYLDSEVENGTVANSDNEFENLVIGADYQLAPGLVPYVEVSFFETDDNVADTASTVDNEGSVILFGTELSF